MTFPKPRYEARPGAYGCWFIWDTERDAAILDTHSHRELSAQAQAAVLNAEYQRWLTARFYDRAVAELHGMDLKS